MATCPPNSTDCLLQAILDAQGGFNWNPPTFGATVAIGILAVIIAMMTVFQGALTAGPGRLKASSRAIGPIYYLKTRTEFSWIELRFRTTAWVPYIDVLGWFDRTEELQGSLSRHFRKHPSYGAGWLNLINSVPPQCQHWSVTRCQTDYLPSDVQAAPARASIRAVVELAILSGCDSVKVLNDLPLARGCGSQLSFRDHPYLGISAVYDQFVINDEEHRIDVRKCHLLHLAGHFSFQIIPGAASQFDGKSASHVSSPNSLGVLDALNLRKRPTGELTPYESHSVESGLVQGTLKAMSLGLLTWDSPESCIGLPYAKLKIREAVLALRQTCQSWANCQGQIILRSLDHLLQSRSNLLAYDRNGDFRKPFEAELVQPQLGWTWLAGTGTSGLIRDDDWRSGPEDLRLHQGKFCWWQWRVDGTVDFPLAVMPRDGHLVILPAALETCVSWLEKPELFDEYTSAQKTDARFAVGHQLREVDYWLLHHGSAESAEQVLGILMDFTELDSHVDPALPDTGARSGEPSAEWQHTASAEPIRPSTELRRPHSFERVRPPQFYERGRTGFYEQRPRSRSRSGWRFASSSRSPRGSFVSLVDPKKVLGRGMQEQRDHDISLLNESPPKISRRGNQRRSGHKIYEKKPSEGFNRNRRPEVLSRATQGTMFVYRERIAGGQPIEDSLGKTREGIFESTTDVDRETLLIRKRRHTKGEGNKEMPGIAHGSDSDPTASSSKGALVLYQRKKARDGTHQGLRKRYRSNNSETASISQTGPLVIYGGEETSSETAQQLSGRSRNDPVDTTNPQKDALVISNEEKEKDGSVKELPERTRRLLDRNTNYVAYGETSSDNNERDLPKTSINKGLPYEGYSSTSEAGPYRSDILEMIPFNPEDLSDESSRPKKGRPAPRGDFRESFSGDDITTRRGERRTSDHFQKDRYDGDIRSWSDNRRSSDDSQSSFSKGSPQHRPKTRGSIRYGGRLPSAKGRGKAEQRQGGAPALKKHTKRRAQMGHQQTTGNDENDYGYTNPDLARLEGPDSRHAHETESPLTGSRQLIRGKASPADMGMRTLLVYRAILFATLCALAADTSCVYETELGRRIVQVL